MKSFTQRFKSFFRAKKLEQENFQKLPNREYPRLVLFKAGESLRAFPKTYILWPTTKQALAVFDLSYTGLAFQPPANFQANLNDKIQLELHIQTNKVLVTGHWIRKTDQVVAIKISHLGPEARKVFNKFFEEKLMAFHLISVDPKFFDRRQNFQTWLRGPMDTDIFLWTTLKENLQIEAFEIKYLDFLFTYNGHSFKCERGKMGLASREAAADEKNSEALIEKFRSSIRDNSFAETSDEKFIASDANSSTWQKLIEMLGLAIENHPILETLIALIKNKNKELSNGS